MTRLHPNFGPQLKRMPLLASVFLLAVALGGCSEEQPAADKDVRVDVVIEFPEGDPSVPPELGGPGFAPSPEDGWQTNSDFPYEGSPSALPGGAVRYWMRFPPTIRTVGKDSSTQAARMIEKLCFEPLLTRHSDTLEYMPRLASHWWISDDEMTFRFRINPRAHWADGTPVAAEDVIATWELVTDATILQPALQGIYGQFLRPTARSKYLIEVKTKGKSWRNFLNFASLQIFPAHQIQKISGEKFRGKYQFLPLTGSGPYELRPSDVRKGHHLTFRRRADYWGNGERFAVGRYNFDLIRLVSTEDSVLGLEKTKKGEIDLYRVGKAKEWAVDLPRLDQVQRGLLVMSEIDNDEPLGASGIVINMRIPPLDDVRVRKALCYLYNRRKLIEKLFYRQYEPLHTYFPGTDYANPQNEPIDYNPDEARRLLAAAGWTEMNRAGILVKDGRPLELELIYSSKVVERYLSIFQRDCRKAGVMIHLKQLTRASRFQMTYGNRSFQLATQGWGGALDPNPAVNWLSTLADKKNNNNLAGLNNPRVDALCAKYERTFQPEKRKEILRAIDGLIYQQHPCILGWTAGRIRLIYWNKFGHPSKLLGRTSSAESALTTWWLDPERERRLKRAKQNSSIQLEAGPTRVTY